MSSPTPTPKSSTSPWIILAITSGAFAALNGVFAKFAVISGYKIETEIDLEPWDTSNLPALCNSRPLGLGLPILELDLEHMGQLD
ncbi:hypothetical protein PENANT_c007G06470 [Penicillium antarcticum]|uniref:Uncharacterized protein n=1 Tax=Penicillium antarcticum TaxID=416450 RepID=A0A1V6QBU0_9EURO|nr:hypothetical protein PENANT_c007G06470 [Penicillium antarcticum]